MPIKTLSNTAVAKAAREFIIWSKNIENSFNSLIIIMKSWGEGVCAEGREGWWDSSGEDGLGKGFIRCNSYEKKAFVWQDSPEGWILHRSTLNTGSEGTESWKKPSGGSLFHVKMSRASKKPQEGPQKR